jgi:O-acetyl-ADP-ribose deacetylase (regulator of RNase III)
MDVVGSEMLYPVSVIDGLVHQLGGEQLVAECRHYLSAATLVAEVDPCPVGTAVRTTSGNKDSSKLRQYYNDGIIHTAPPFYRYDVNPEEKLMQCYMNSFQLAFSVPENEKSTTIPVVRVAVPLLGAGARGFPVDVAIKVAANAAVMWLDGGSTTATNDHEKIVLNEQEKNQRNDSTNNNHHHQQKLHQKEQTIAFGILEAKCAEQLCAAIGQKYSQT